MQLKKDKIQTQTEDQYEASYLIPTFVLLTA